MTSPVSPSLQSMQHDKSYYIHSADLVFLVENRLFRVHRYFFERESVYFQTLLATPHPENEPAPGSSDSSAIILDTTASQFSRFLWVFYNPKYSLYDEATLEDWKSILSLSHRWLFPEIKNLAIRHLQNHHLLSPVHRIQLYHSNAVDRALLVGDYLALCQRPEPLTLREGLDLGLETTLMVARTREEIRAVRSPEGVLTPLTPTVQGPELIDLIGKLFVDSRTSDDEEKNEDDSSSSSLTLSSNGAPLRPTIRINGLVGGEKTRNGLGSGAFGLGSGLNPNSGGSPSKPQATRQTEQQQQQQSQTPTKTNQQKKNQKKNQKKEQGQKTTEPVTTAATTTKSPTAAAAETKEAAEETNEENQKTKNNGETPRIDTPGAGQQGAGSGGEANGRGANGNDNEKETTKGGSVDVPQGGGDVKPGAGTNGSSTEAGPPKADGAGDTTQGGVDSEANRGGTGGAGQTNGDVDKDKDKTKDTQQSPTTTTTKPVTSPVNGVGRGTNGNNNGRAKTSSMVDDFLSLF